MSAGPRRRYWNPAGIVFATLFLAVGALFCAAAALALGWIEPPGDLDGAAVTPFGPLGASLVAVVFLYLGMRCNLWVDVEDRAVVVRGVLVSRRLPRDPRLAVDHEFGTRPTGLRFSSGERSVVVYPRPKDADDLMRLVRGG